MTSDSINDEILQIKHDLAAKFDNDLERIVADAKSRERGAITLPPRPCSPLTPGALTPGFQPLTDELRSPASEQ